MQEESPAFPTVDDAQRDAIIARLFDGVLRSARSQLLRADSPLAAEVWGSGLMAVWEGLPAATGGNPFSPGGDTAASFIEALIRHAAELRTPDGMAVLCALAAVGPTRIATRARTAAAGLEQIGVPAPVWAGVSSIGVSWTIVNSLFSHNHAIGNGANPAQAGTPGGGSGGGIYNDGNTMTLSLCGTLIEQNDVKAHGAAIFFVTNDHSGNIVINDSIIRNNAGGSWYARPGISMHDDTRIEVNNSTLEP